MEEFIMLICLGLTLGFVSSFLGIGGGSITVPLLYSLYPSMPATQIIAISLGSIFIISSFNSYQYYKKDLLPQRKIILTFFITCLFGALIGGELLYLLDAGLIKKILGIILIIMTVKVLFKGKPSAQKRIKNPTTFKMGLIGFIGTLLSSLTGLGGGIIFTPAFLGPAKLEIKRVAPYSNMAMVFATSLGLLPHIFTQEIVGPNFQSPILNSLMVGNINIIVIICLGLSSLFSSRAGVILNETVSENKKRIILASLLIILSIKVIVS